MARKQKPPEKGPSKAYLVSFGDTMTTLLAFFIIMNSLAKEQTGANMHSGTGSFVRALNSLGMPGGAAAKHSDNAISRNDTSPLYVVPNADDQPPEMNPTGPDEEDDHQRVIDHEADQFERFMVEMKRLMEGDSQPDISGEIVFDFFDRLNRTSPYLREVHLRAFAPIIPQLRNERYQIDVVVWATMPSQTAWTRATRQAAGVADEIAMMLRLPPRDRERLTSAGRVWISSTEKRPVVTLVVRRRSGRSDAEVNR